MQPVRQYNIFINMRAEDNFEIRKLVKFFAHLCNRKVLETGPKNISEPGFEVRIINK